MATTPEANTRRAVRVAYQASNRNAHDAARRAWALACYLSFRMGGLSGAAGRAAILFPGGAVAWAPALLIQTRKAAA